MNNENLNGEHPPAQDPQQPQQQTQTPQGPQQQQPQFQSQPQAASGDGRSRFPTVLVAVVGSFALLAAVGGGAAMGAWSYNARSAFLDKGNWWSITAHDDRDDDQDDRDDQDTDSDDDDVVAGTSSGQSSGQSSTQANAATGLAGVVDLDISVAAESFDVVFADVAEASLKSEGNGQWAMVREGNELKVTSPKGAAKAANNRATLTLPQSLNNNTLDLDVSLAAGKVTVTGNFAEVAVDVAGGKATVSGSARSLDVDLVAGQADVNLADVSQADFSLTAGSVNATLTGAAPAETDIEVVAGTLNLTLPSDQYRVVSEAVLGKVTNNLNVGASATNVVNLEVSGGTVTLK